MIELKPRYSKEEFAQRGGEIYERDIRPLVEADNKGKYVVIDIESGEYEMDANEVAAFARLRQRLPGAQIWLVRVGAPTARRFGLRIRPVSS